MRLSKLDIHKVIETEKVIIFNIYYNRYGKIDTQKTYIKLNYKAIRKTVSEIYSNKTYFY